MIGDFDLEQNVLLKILIGQAGAFSSSSGGGSGGGGIFISLSGSDSPL